MTGVQTCALPIFQLDQELNEAGHEGVISTENSKVKVMLVPTNEELAMVQQIKAQLD